MKTKIAFVLFVFSFLIFKHNLSAQELYTADKTIELPGTGSYDYLFIDKQNNKLYVSHASAVNVIDLGTEKAVGSIDNLKKCHGIAIVNKLNRGFISDGNANTVVVFDINTLKIIQTIALSGKKPDAIIYDSYSNKVFAFNGGSNNVSVIDVETMKETTTIDLGGGPEFAVTNGAGKIYNNIEDLSSLKVIDSKTLTVTNTYPLAPCGGPTGITLDSANNRLFTVCRENKGMSVVDATNGKVITTVPIGTGVDAVAFDPITKLVFCSNGDGTTTIIKQETADKYTVVQTLKTVARAKTLALDTVTHKIYLSVNDPATNSFKVLVYKLANK